MDDGNATADGKRDGRLPVDTAEPGAVGCFVGRSSHSPGNRPG
ncbi:hypothetical protein ACWFR1_24325 [Streptomyces sp. NPDC055103]